MKNNNLPNKPQAFSHMIWFFLIPAILFVCWITYKLAGSLNEKKTSEFQTTLSKINKIENSNSSGERWQSAYFLAEDIQKKLAKNELIFHTPEEEKKALTKIKDLLKEYDSDLRLKRYLVLIISQMENTMVLETLAEFVNDKDDRVRFFAAWGYLNILLKNKESINKDHLDLISKWTQSDDNGFKKISASFLVQQPNKDYYKPVRQQLKDPNTEVRWNAAVALAKVEKSPETNKVLEEVFNIKNLRSLDIRSSKDLHQILRSAYLSVVETNNTELLKLAEKLKNSVNPSTPEGKVIFKALTVPKKG